jgi:tetratricopeptide (TPR) repeat protein
LSLADDILDSFRSDPPSWLLEFPDRPGDSLTALFSEGWFPGHLSAVDPSDLLLDWAHGLSNLDEFGNLLDSAIAEWIRRWWGRGDPSGDGMQELIWHRVLRVVAHLDQAELANAELWSRRSEAEGVLGPMTRNAARDPMGWYWTCLANSQDAHANSQDADALLDDWWRLCNLSLEVPHFHGRIGLLGMRGLPGDDLGRFRESVAAALLRLARALDDRVKERSLGQRLASAAARTAAIETARAYPFPDAWRDFWDAESDRLEERPRKWLAAVFGQPRSAKQHTKTGLPRPQPDWHLRARNIADQLKRGEAKAVGLAESLLAEQRHYAERTGDGYFFVRSLDSCSTSVRRLEPKLAWAWAEEGLRWDRWSAIAWTTAVQALVATDDLSTAGLYALEAVERFPDNAIAQSVLAEVLQAKGDLNDAEAVYRSALRRFRDDPALWRGLAGVLALRGDVESILSLRGEASEEFGEELIGGHLIRRAEVRAQEAHTSDLSHAPGDGVGSAEPVVGRDELDAPGAQSAEELVMGARLLVRLATLRPTDHGEALKLAERLVDGVIERQPAHMSATFTRLELLLDQRRIDDADSLISGLPDYLLEKPQFLVLRGRTRWESLRHAGPTPFDESWLNAVVQPWRLAGDRNHVLSAAWPFVQLRASGMLHDGDALQRVRSIAIGQVGAEVTRSTEAGSDNDLTQSQRLRGWWVKEMTSTIPVFAEREDGSVPTFDDVAPLLVEHADVLDDLERELVDATRYMCSAS